MCWAFRVADVGIRAASTAVVEPHLGRIIGSGRNMPILVRRGEGYTWMDSRYGMALPGEKGRRNLVWNARDDRLDGLEAWSNLVRQRFAVPIDAYAEKYQGEIWMTGGPAFMIGMYDEDIGAGGGAVAITTEGPGGRPPILVSRADAAKWLEAKQWEAFPLAKSLPRVPFREADVFESKRLEIDARNNVPAIRKAA